jgi:hypothetical protein
MAFWLSLFFPLLIGIAGWHYLFFLAGGQSAERHRKSSRQHQPNRLSANQWHRHDSDGGAALCRNHRDRSDRSAQGLRGNMAWSFRAPFGHYRFGAARHEVDGFNFAGRATRRKNSSPDLP